ncbi:unnamed protein product [Ectocarpus sp. 12 AP-2014]
MQDREILRQNKKEQTVRLRCGATHEERQQRSCSGTQEKITGRRRCGSIHNTRPADQWKSASERQKNTSGRSQGRAENEPRVEEVGKQPLDDKYRVQMPCRVMVSRNRKTRHTRT